MSLSPLTSYHLHETHGWGDSLPLEKAAYTILIMRIETVTLCWFTMYLVRKKENKRGKNYNQQIEKRVYTRTQWKFTLNQTYTEHIHKKNLLEQPIMWKRSYRGIPRGRHQKVASFHLHWSFLALQEQGSLQLWKKHQLQNKNRGAVLSVQPIRQSSLWSDGCLGFVSNRLQTVIVCLSVKKLKTQKAKSVNSDDDVCFIVFFF